MVSEELEAIITAAITHHEGTSAFKIHSIVPVSPAQAAAHELIAVITAAVAELEGTQEFQVVRIQRNNPSSWAITARQELMHSRL
jgi:hypothetical protein